MSFSTAVFNHAGATITLNAQNADDLLAQLSKFNIGAKDAAPAPAPAKPKAAEKAAAPAASAEPAQSPAPSPAAAVKESAPADKVDYPTLQKAVFKLAGISRDEASAAAQAFGVKTFKELDSAKWGDALKAVEAKIEELAAVA